MSRMMTEHESRFKLGESAYGRDKELCIAQNDHEGIWCDVCSTAVKSSPVISTDVSNGEYGPMSICKPCLDDKVKSFTSSCMQQNLHPKKPSVL